MCARHVSVLLISGEYPPLEGGVGDYTHQLAAEMARQEARTAVLTSSSAGEERLEDDVLCLPRVTRWTLPSLLRAVKQTVEQFKPDIALIQYQTAAYGLDPAINVLPGIVRGLPFAVTFHDLRTPYLFPKAGRLRRWVNDHLARSCRAVIVTNQQDQAALAGDRRISRLELVPIGSNIIPTNKPGLAQELRADWQLGRFTLVIGYFGLINESKGVIDLIKAVKSLADMDMNVGLLMIGGGVGASDPTNASYLEQIKAYIGQQQLTQRVVWTGFLAPAEVSAAFECADLVVLPYHDGVSFRRGSLMAALAHGKPIISTLPMVPLPELTSEVMALVPPRDYASLARVIHDISRDRDLCARMARNSMRLAERFTWPDIARRTLEVLVAALER